jgi:hypothetical protein
VTGDAPFEIHYADANGSEIPPEPALKAAPAITKKTAKPEQWTLSYATSEQGRSDRFYYSPILAALSLTKRT